MPVAIPIIGAVAAVGGAVIQGNAAKSAARTQADAANKQIAASDRYNQEAKDRYAGDIAQGDAASKLYAGLLGDGGDPAASQAALDTWRNSISYKDTMNAALKSVNANAYTNGFGRSGAAMKALQDRSTMLANQNQQTYLGNLQNQINVGANAKNAVTGAAGTALGYNNAAIQNSANAQSNATLATGASWSNAIGQIANLAGSAYQSSYGGGLSKAARNSQTFSLPGFGV